MKTTAIVGIASALIGMFIGTQLPKGITSETASITTFKIKVPFDQWAKGFDSKEATKIHKANDIKPFFRGVNINDPAQVIVIHQAKPGVVEKFLSENKEMIESSGHIVRTSRVTNWSAQ